MNLNPKRRLKKWTRAPGCRARHLAAFFLLCATEGSSLYANTYQSLGNQRNILPGGKAALMGGAFEALADDSTAGFYNPAGLALLKEDRLQVSATGYRTAEAVYEKVFAEEPFREASSGFFPNFIGGTQKLGPMRLGYEFLTLDVENISQQDRFEDLSSAIGAPTSYARTYQEKSEYIWAGASIAMRVANRLSLGMSTFYYQRTRQLSANEVLGLRDGSLSATASALDTLNTGAVAVLGLLWRHDSFSLALVSKIPRALSNKTTQTFDRLAYQGLDAADSSVGGPLPQPPVLTSGRALLRTLGELNPLTHVLGVAWTPFPKAALAASLLMHTPPGQETAESASYHTRSRFDVSLGGEIGVGPLSLLGGLFTNRSLYEPPTEGGFDQPPAIDFSGTTLGFSLNFGSLTGCLGVARQTGRGSAQVKSEDASIQTMRSASMTYLLSGKVPL